MSQVAGSLSDALARGVCIDSERTSGEFCATTSADFNGSHLMPLFLSRVVKMPKDSIPELLPKRGTHDVFGQAQL